MSGIDLSSRSSIVPHVALSMCRDLVAAAEPPPDVGPFTLTYAGSLDANRSPAQFLRALARVARTIPTPPGIRFRVVGADRSATRELVRGLGIQHIVEYLGVRTYQDTLRLLYRSHVLVLIEAPLQEGIFLPSKIADYIQVGKPILAVSPVVGEVADLLNRHGGGIAVDQRSPEAIVAGLQELYEAWCASALASRYASGQLLHLCCEKAVADIYGGLFRRVLGHGGGHGLQRRPRLRAGARALGLV
jgi:glycosyltransferase involved in cell wall biosynthesis